MSALEAWYIDESVTEDQRLSHKLHPNHPVSLQELQDIGVCYWKVTCVTNKSNNNKQNVISVGRLMALKMEALGAHVYITVYSGGRQPLNADIYGNDPELQKIREEKGYSYMDIIDIHPDKLPDYEDKLKTFYEEHLHLDDEIRYVLDGRAYFDVRDKNDRWIRIAMAKGDMITLPAGIYHRFTMDETNYTKAMRLFVGEPVWKAYNRPADHFEIRKQYVDSLNCS